MGNRDIIDHINKRLDEIIEEMIKIHDEIAYGSLRKEEEKEKEEKKED